MKPQITKFKSQINLNDYNSAMLRKAQPDKDYHGELSGPWSLNIVIWFRSFRISYFFLFAALSRYDILGKN